MTEEEFVTIRDIFIENCAHFDDDGDVNTGKPEMILYYDCIKGRVDTINFAYQKVRLEKRNV